MGLSYRIFARPLRPSRAKRTRVRKLGFEECERRILMSATPLSHDPASLGGSHLAADAAVYATTLAADLTAYRPQQTSGSYAPFTKTAVAEPSETDPKLGPGIRINGDDDNGNGICDRLDNSVARENDLIEVTVEAGGTSYILKRSSDANLRVWTSPTKGPSTELAFGVTQRTVALSCATDCSQLTVWVEWAGPAQGSSTLTLQPASGTGPVDSLVFHTFHSIAYAIGGETFSSNPPPPDPTYGVWKVGAQLYGEGYDIHLLNEGNVGTAYGEVRNAVRSQGVTQVAMLGYSHGGGDIYTLANKLYADRRSIGAFSIAFTAYMDAIQNRSNLDTAPEARRPTGSSYHVNYYRGKGIVSELWLHGVATQGSGAGFQLNVQTTAWGAKATHTGPSGISLFTQVQTGIHDQFVTHVIA